MTNNDTATNPIITLENMGGTYKVEVDKLNIALILCQSRGLLEAGNLNTLRYLAAGACGYPDPASAFLAWNALEVVIAWVESGNFV